MKKSLGFALRLMFFVGTLIGVSVIGLAGCGGGNNTPTSGAPTITTNPANVTVAAGATAMFTAAATGNPTPTVQWQVSAGGAFTNVAGATSTTLSVSGATAAMNGNMYQAVFMNSAGSATTTAATLTISSANTAPTITTNPANVTVTAGATAMFTAAASGSPTPTVQWQVSAGGGAFTNVAGATSTTLAIAGTTTAMNGNKYQAVFTNAAGSATTSSATLTVNAANTAPTITTNPANVTVTAGATATFTAAASGTPIPTVQWQVSTNGGAAFTNVAGATSTTLSITGTTNAMSGNKYQAVFTNSAGAATTSAATLTVNAANTAPTITTNPADTSVAAGATATFTAAASGAPTPTVQWQVSSSGGAFTNVAGATSTTLSITDTTMAMSGNKYQAVFTNSAGSATTSAATLTVTAAAATSGTVLGGLVPITGSTIQLYAVGTTGDGSASTPLLAGTAVVSDGSGTFSLPAFSCPTPGTLVFITASGGNPGLAAGTNNAAILMMTALGACSTVTSAKQIVINELTTVATVFALETYMTSPTSIGSSAADAADLANDFASVNELVDTTEGTTPGPARPANESVTVTTLNTLADILAACVQTAGGVAGDGSACGKLFTAATPPAPITNPAQPANSRAPQVFLTRARTAKSAAQPDITSVPAAPTNTATATQSMAANPSNNVTTLSAGASLTGPYEPQQSSVPVSWNVIIEPGIGGNSNGNFVSASLPAGINVPEGTTSTFSTTVINTSAAAQTLTVAPTTLSSLPVTLLACATDPATNACLGAPSSSFSVTIPPNQASATFTTFVTATAAIPYNPVNNVVYLTFEDTQGTVQAVGFANVNTETNVEAFQVLEATASGNDVLTIPFSTQGTGAFAVEAANFGPAIDGAVVGTTSGNLPVSVTICQTIPSTGQCLAAPNSTVTLSIPTGTSAVFSVFVTATAAIASDPTSNRIYVQITNPSGTGGGLTSVAVVTN